MQKLGSWMELSKLCTMKSFIMSKLGALYWGLTKYLYINRKILLVKDKDINRKIDQISFTLGALKMDGMLLC